MCMNDSLSSFMMALMTCINVCNTSNFQDWKLAWASGLSSFENYQCGTLSYLPRIPSSLLNCESFGERC